MGSAAFCLVATLLAVILERIDSVQRFCALLTCFSAVRSQPCGAFKCALLPYARR